MPDIGFPAPEFALPDQDGQIRRLSDFRGRKVVLYFYSKDGTSGCTRQNLAYAALHGAFEAQNTVVIGISKDSAAAHRRYADQQGLSQILLSDEEKSVLSAYGVWKEKNMYGKKVMGVVRSSFLIDEKGILRQALLKVKPEDNAAQMLDIVQGQSA